MARGYALVYSAASFASAAGPYIFGVIADAYGIHNAVAGMAVVALLSAARCALEATAKSRSTPDIQGSINLKGARHYIRHCERVELVQLQCQLLGKHQVA